jgi:asparagine synthase (glutamine-hydrolysing)
MCGIAGILGVGGDTAAAIHDVKQMTASLVHRGPDDSGLASGEGWVLGMCRLAVQDVSQAGHQPMRSHGLTLAFNGEVYNFPALRRELEGVGSSFRSGSDTEVVLHALEHWGLEALNRFNGMFALALVDEQRRRAWLARDRFGKKPLFVARLRRGLAFASELKAIMRIARDELTIDRRALAEYFRFQYVPGSTCIFGQVEKLPAASWVQVDIDSGRCSPAREFWTLPKEPPATSLPTPADVLATVSEAVTRRLVADVPVGAFLSGGTDSSLVVACMCDAQADVRTFSIGFQDPRFDESRYALAVAEHLGTDHTHLQLEPSDAMAIVPQLSDAYDEPFADSSAIPTMAVARLARQRVTVALSGDGGDELFGGYPRYRVGRILRLARLTRLMPARAVLKTMPSPRSVSGRRLQRLLSSLAQAASTADAYQELVSVWRSRELAALMPDVILGSSFNGTNWVSNAGVVERMMRCDARTYLIDDILQKVDRATMAVSLEARNPLLDPAVVSLALGAVKLAEAAPGRKPLLRAALKLRLPEHLVERPKMGFGVPVGEWMRQEMRPLLEDLVLARKDAEYDLGVARELCHGHLAGDRDATPQVWSLLAFELWRERWLSTTGASS